MNIAEKKIRELLRGTGITLNGDRDFDIQVNDERLFPRVLSAGSLGLGEAYMDGWWDSAAVDETIARLLAVDIERSMSPVKLIIPVLWSRFMNRQTKSRAFDIGERHYDIGNDLYTRMLDRRMVYTCAYWDAAGNLDEAQEAKLDLVCRKLGLAPGMRLLDIGCGWGSLVGYAAENYGVEAVGLTVSKEQAEMARRTYGHLPVEIRLQDYRDCHDVFDRVASLGMFEHVGARNYAAYMAVVERCLADDGLFLLHTIGTRIASEAVDPWIDRYIFPGGMLPSQSQIAAASESSFIMEDWHNFGANYDPTLMAWLANFEDHRDELAELGYDERFMRMWRFYLCGSAGSFRARRIQLWQIVYSRRGVPGGYRSIR